MKSAVDGRGVDMNTETNRKKTLIELFIEGCREGFTVVVQHIMPAMIFAFILVFVLETTGLMNFIGKITSPIMALWGLPGEASVVLISAFFAKAAGAGVAAALYNNGVLTAEQATILYPAVILMGTLIGHYVRVVVVAGTLPKYHPLLLGICLVDAAISMWITMLII